MRQGKHKPWAAPPSRPSKEGRGPADNVQAGAGQRRLRQTAGQAGDRDGESAPNIPRETGAGRAEADCEAQIRRQEPCRETLETRWPYMMNKYRVHEVAKDFKLNSKDIAEIHNQIPQTPKNHMQVLEERELAVIFDYLTQHNQVENIESILRTSTMSPSRPRRSQPSHSRAPPSRLPRGRAGHRALRPRPTRAGSSPAPREASRSRPRPAPPPACRRRRWWTPARAAAVNLEKYDERLESFTDQRQQDRGGKQKFQGRNAQRQRGRQQGPGNKRKQEEQERLRRLQLEIAKKAPVKVLIPDEIGVGELASRMKKTGAEVVKCLIKNGVMASLSDIIDFDTAAIIAEEMGCKVEKEVVVTIEEKLIDTTRTRRRIWCPAPPWWWSWATWTTARPPCWTISATPTWPPERPAASPSTSAPIRWR